MTDVLVALRAKFTYLAKACRQRSPVRPMFASPPLETLGFLPFMTTDAKPLP